MPPLLRDLVLIDLLVLGFFALVAANYAVVAVAAFPHLLRLRRRLDTFHAAEAATAAVAPPVTLIVPMYNEGAVCVTSVQALLAVKYPNAEILVVNDGSKDDTVERLAEAFTLEPAARFPTATIPTAEVRGVYRSQTRPDLWLIDKANGGKADALNVGVNFCRTPLLCMIDGDSLLGRDAFLRAVQPFQIDHTTVAVGGTVGIVNGSQVRHGVVQALRLPRRMIARFQVLEYFRAFASARVGWAALNALVIVSGAFGLFRREAVVAVGGLDHTTVGEDMELVIRLHRHYRDRNLPYRVAYVPDAVSWTECPESWRVLGRQRDRWHRGLAETLWRHRTMLFNPRYGRIGWLALPSYLFVELLGPVVETLGYVTFAVLLALGFIDLPAALLLALLALLFGVTQSLLAVALEQLAFHRYTRLRDLALLLALTVAENFGYRQLTVWWRLRGLWKFFRSDRSWGEMTRVGFSTS